MGTIYLRIGYSAYASNKCYYSSFNKYICFSLITKTWPFKSNFRHFRPKLVHWNESVYCTPIARALKIWFNEASDSFLRPTIPELGRFLWNQLQLFLDKINTQISENFQQFFVIKQGVLVSKKYKKTQFWVKWLHNMYLTKAKSRTLSTNKNTKI